MLLKARRLVQPPAITEFEWPLAAPAGIGGRMVFAGEMPGRGPHAPAAEPADLAHHQQRIDELEREAFAKGFAQGERAGADASRERGEAVLRRLTQTIEELTTLRSEMIHRTERQMIELALAVARRIVHREVAIDQDLLIAMARVALDRLGESAQVTVRLHPQEFEATAAAHAAEWTGTSVKVVADPRVSRGGCRVESEFGMVDAGVDAQIHELARALLGTEEAVAHVIA